MAKYTPKQLEGLRALAEEIADVINKHHQEMRRLEGNFQTALERYDQARLEIIQEELEARGHKLSKLSPQRVDDIATFLHLPPRLTVRADEACGYKTISVKAFGE